VLRRYTSALGVALHERSREDQYRKLFDDLAVGFYFAERVGERDIVVDCNESFARICGLDSPDEIIGRDLGFFHGSATEKARFVERLSNAATSGSALLAESMRIRTNRGEIKTIEISARPKVQDGQIIGQTGAVRDITAEIETRKTVTTLLDDIGAVLHVFRQTLVQLGLSIRAVQDVLAGTPDAPNAAQTPEEIEADVRGPLHALRTATSAFLHREKETAPLSRHDMERLEYLTDAMLACTQEVPKPHWRDVWRAAAVEIDSICKKVKPRTIARSLQHAVQIAARDISRITGLATLSAAREAIAAVDAPIISLREFVTSGVRPTEQARHLIIESCVHDAIGQLAAFAAERQVRLLFDDQSRTAIMGVPQDITRALSNLLHNAIKYSWRRENRQASVRITVSQTNSRTVGTCVENWGVPIPVDEIVSGLIFRLGFRGRLSSDRGRMGTGVGLADSINIARSHGGDVRITSRPATSTGDPANYKQPFVTHVCLDLPLAPEESQP
jgi:PAS domain S-box-containing protein